MFPAINIGPLVVPTAAFVFIIGAWLLLTIAERIARQLELDPQVISSLVTAGLLGGFLGARLTFVALYWSSFEGNLLGIVWPINAGYVPAGGLVFGGLAMFFYGRHKRLELWPTLDAVAPIAVCALIIVSLADFLGGPGYGTTTNLPWGIAQFGVRRHAVQIYEIVAGALALLVWWRFRERRLYAGQLFLLTTTVYCLGRLLVDAFRQNTWILPGGWHGLQIAGLLLAVACLIILTRKAQESAAEPS